MENEANIAYLVYEARIWRKKARAYRFAKSEYRGISDGLMIAARHLKGYFTQAWYVNCPYRRAG